MQEKMGAPQALQSDARRGELDVQGPIVKGGGLEDTSMAAKMQRASAAAQRNHAPLLAPWRAADAADDERLRPEGGSHAKEAACEGTITRDDHSGGGDGAAAKGDGINTGAHACRAG